MKLTKVQKIMSGTIVGVMMLSASAGAVFAQDDTTEEANAPICVMERAEDDNPLQALLDELGLTREDIRDYEGTLDELLAENGVDVEALRAEREAGRTTAMLDCVTALEDAGSLTAEQADNLRTAIEDGSLETLREEGFGGRSGERGHNPRNGRNGRGGRDGGFFFGDGDASDDVAPEATTEADA